MIAPTHGLVSRPAGFHPPRFGLGGSRLGEPSGPEVPSRSAETALATVDAAYQAGIRFFDTSPAYGDGLSEQRLGFALARRPRGEYLISTKVIGPDVRGSLAASVERLGLGVDLALLQDPAPSALGSSLADLAELRRDGVIKAIGVASADWQLLDRFVQEAELDAVLLSRRYTLLDQSATPLLERCQVRGVAVIVSGVLGASVLQLDRSKSATDPQAVRARRIAGICEQYGVSLPQLAIAFPARHPAVTSVLISAARPAEIRADAALVRQPVPAALWRDPDLLELLG